MKADQKKFAKPILNEDLTEINLPSVIDFLEATLDRIKPGMKGASEYHNLIIGILELVFYPSLTKPIKEAEINDGRKRIDITFENSAQGGIFYRLYSTLRVFCPYVSVECKNYSTDPGNPELDQLYGRFSNRRGQFGILVCRNIDDRDLLLKRCHDSYVQDGELVIPIDDSDLIFFMEALRNNTAIAIDEKISSYVRQICST